MSIINCFLIFLSGVTDKAVCTPNRHHIPCFIGAQGTDLLLENFPQVLASVLVSVLLVGLKLNAAKEIVQIGERRAELKKNLAVLLWKLEDEDEEVWIGDVHHDTKEREEKIAALGLASGLVYSMMETAAVERCLGMFALFERQRSNSEAITQLKHGPTIAQLESTYDKATRLQFGFATLEIRAAPLEIAAYFLNCDCRFVLSGNAADPNVIRHEVLEYVNAHHTIVFRRQPRPLCCTRCPDPPPTPQRTRKLAPTNTRTRCADTG
jgi:hypothetical protein